MIKQAVIIRLENIPIMCSSIVTFKSPEEFKKCEQECKENLEIIMNEKRYIISQMQKDLKLALLEIDLLRGRISDEEYESKKEKLL